MKFYYIFSLLFLIFTACENDLAEVKRIVSKDEIAVEKAKNIEMLYSDSAIVKVRVKSLTLLRHLDKKDPRQEFPDGIEVEFFTPGGQVSSWMISNYAIRHENENKVIVRDSVVWESHDNERLETEELIWEEDKNLVYTNKFVVIRRPEEILYGYGFESNQEFTEWSINAIEGRVKAEGLGKEIKN